MSEIFSDVTADYLRAIEAAGAVLSRVSIVDAVDTEFSRVETAMRIDGSMTALAQVKAYPAAYLRTGLAENINGGKA